MILSNLKIQQALDEKRLIITPEPHPRKPEPGVKECPYDTHSVDLRLHNEIRKPKPGTYSIDLAEPGLADFITRNSELHTLVEKQPYTLVKGEFILARTIERIELPIKDSPPFLAARIEGKSSRARCGLLVHFTAPTVHPGFAGSLTLEIINLGPSTFLLRSGMYIAQLIVEQVDGDIFMNPSQFQNQNTPQGQTI